MSILPSLSHINGDKHKNEMLAFLTTESSNRNNYLTKQGEEGSKLYFLISGRVKVFYNLPSGRNMLVSEVSDGTMIGEECIFDECGLYKYSTQVSSQEVKILSLTKKYCQNKLPYETLIEITNYFIAKDRSRMSLVKKLGDKSKVAKIINSTKLHKSTSNNLLVQKKDP